MCASVSVKLVADLVFKLRLDRALGIDCIFSAMLKHASPFALKLILTLYNEMLLTDLNFGKMSLVDKKKLSCWSSANVHLQHPACHFVH